MNAREYVTAIPVCPSVSLGPIRAHVTGIGELRIRDDSIVHDPQQITMSSASALVLARWILKVWEEEESSP